MRENQNEQPIPGCKVMSKDGFWNLIAEVKAACGQDQEKYMDMLIGRLKELGPKYAKDFHDIVHAYEDLAYKYGLWSAAGLISYTSDDGFIDFRAWLISQGKKAYYAALKDPDTLADLDSGDGYWFESFTYAGYFALEELTGEDAYASYDKAAHENIVRALKADIKYAEWINYPFMPSETSEYYPRLYEKYMARSEQLSLLMKWDNGRSLSLMPFEDSFTVIPEEPQSVLDEHLYEKVRREQDAFRDELLALSPREILDKAWEYLVREDILLAMEYNELNDVQAQALLELPDTMSDLCGAVMEKDTRQQEVIWHEIEQRANALAGEQQPLQEQSL